MRRYTINRYKVVQRKSDSSTTYFVEIAQDLSTGIYMVYFPATRTFDDGFKSKEEALVHLGLRCAECNATFMEVGLTWEE